MLKTFILPTNFLKNQKLLYIPKFLKMPLSFTHTSQSFLDTMCTNKLYELRLFKTHPKDNAKFLKLSEETIPIKKNVAKLLAYFNTEFGSLNTCVQLWEYDSYKDRLASWEKLHQDDKWNKSFVEKAFPMIVKEENMTMRRISDEPLLISSSAPALGHALYYRMNSYIIKPPMIDNILKFKELTGKYNKELIDAGVNSVQNIAIFLPESDKTGKLIEFVRQANMDDTQMYKKRRELSSLRDQIHDVANLVESQILVPVSFSPMK